MKKKFFFKFKQETTKFILAKDNWTKNIKYLFDLEIHKVHRGHKENFSVFIFLIFFNFRGFNSQFKISLKKTLFRKDFVKLSWLMEELEMNNLAFR